MNAALRSRGSVAVAEQHIEVHYMLRSLVLRHLGLDKDQSQRETTLN